MKLKVKNLRNYRDQSRRKIPDYTHHIEEVVANGEPEDNGYEWIPDTNLSPEEYQEYMEAFNTSLNQQNNTPTNTQ